MSITWKDFVDAFRIGSNTGNTQKLDGYYDDFDWETSKMDRILHFLGLEILHLGLMVMRRHYMKMQKS